MSKDLDQLTQTIETLGQVSTDEARRIVNEVYEDGVVSRDEAELLFDLNDRLEGSDPLWDERFCETIKDYLLTREQPVGWVTEEECEWLINQVMRDGEVRVATEMELVLSVLRHAEGAPERLGAFALTAVCERIKRLGRATDEEVERCRRAIYAPTGEGAIWVSRNEATRLFQTNDAIAFARNDPSWNDLFARAIGNHLLARAHPDPMTEQEALARENWLSDTSVNPGGFFSRMAGTITDGSWFSKVTHDPEKAAAARRAVQEAAQREAEKVTSAESDWLVKRLAFDKKISPAERALVEFLKTEAPGFTSGLIEASAA